MGGGGLPHGLEMGLVVSFLGFLVSSFSRYGMLFVVGGGGGGGASFLCVFAFLGLGYAYFLPGYLSLMGVPISHCFLN